MRLVVFGSRSLEPHWFSIEREVRDRWGVLPSLLISGDAHGVDRAGEAWADRRGIEVRRMPALWHTWGRRAGIVRNTVMAEMAQAGLCFWDGYSRGTRHMISEMQRLERSLHVVVVPS